MKIKSVESVHFLDNISLQEELHLIYQQSENKPKMNKNKAFGKSLQISDLTKRNNIEYVDLMYALKNENAFFVTMMLLSAFPFTNFLDNFKNKISDLQNFPVLEKMIALLDILRSGMTSNVDKYIPFEECMDLKDGYSFLLRSIHQELCTHMHFEENAWSNQKKGKFFKNIYPEYSPIVEIFQGKIQDDISTMKAGYFEIIKNVDIFSIIKSSNCKKIPTIVLAENNKIIKVEGFIVTSIISYVEKSYVLYIFEDDKFYEYRSTGFKVNEDIKSLEDLKNIKYILYSKIN